ncbi:metal-binding protein [Psychrobacillus sp. FSL K6-4615]|uniref:metal-binding protein n=1 Tax=Psychrobacillus sp. FSL K6-4615 TaxID=2921551 RepID=UPI0030FBE054
MNVTGDYQCNVCEHITRIKVQLGWLEKYPVRIKCSNCNIPIYGEVNLDQKEGTFKVDLNNVTQVEAKNDPDFLIEVSGELLTEKLRTYTGSSDTYFPPYFKSGIFTMGDYNVLEFQRTIVNFLNSIKNNWPVVRRINELWLSENYKYLPKELNKVLNKTNFPADNELEYLRAVHMLNIRFFKPIFQDYFVVTTDFIFKTIKKLLNKDHKIYRELYLMFGPKLNTYEEKIYIIMCKFIEKFPMILPVIGLDFYKEPENKDEAIKKMGLTTVDFEDIKDFYIDTFEDIAEIFDLILAYENLLVRDDFNLMNPNVNKEIKTLKDYQTKMNSKGRKLEFINSLEEFKVLFALKVDNRLRNAIGHRSYKFDIETQLINYYPSGTINKGELEKIYLSEFVIECLQLFRTCLGIGEIIYQTRKNCLVEQGHPLRRTTDYFPDLLEKKVRQITKNNKPNDTYRKKRKKKKIQSNARKINRRKK